MMANGILLFAGSGRGRREHPSLRVRRRRKIPVIWAAWRSSHVRRCTPILGVKGHRQTHKREQSYRLTKDPICGGHGQAEAWQDGRGRLAMPALAIRHDLPAAALRRLARQEPDRRAAMRLLAIAHALDGFSRAEAAR